MQALYKIMMDRGPMIAFLLGVVGVGVTIMSLMSKSAVLSVGDAAKRSGEIAESGALDTAFSITTLFLIICIAGIAIFSLIQLVTDIKGSMKGIIGLVLAAIVFFIAYSTAEVETSGRIAELMTKFQVTDGQSKFISASMIMTGILTIVALGSFVIFEVINFFK